MVNRRVEKGVKRGKSFEIEVDGERLVAYEGETVAAVLVAAGRRTFRWTEEETSPWNVLRHRSLPRVHDGDRRSAEHQGLPNRGDPGMPGEDSKGA